MKNKWMNDFLPDVDEARIFNKLGLTLSRLGVIDFMDMCVGETGDSVCGDPACCGYEPAKCDVLTRVDGKYEEYDVY